MIKSIGIDSKTLWTPVWCNYAVKLRMEDDSYSYTITLAR